MAYIFSKSSCGWRQVPRTHNLNHYNFLGLLVQTINFMVQTYGVQFFPEARGGCQGHVLPILEACIEN